MTRFHWPPGLRSMVLMVFVKPLGPHQFAMCCGSVHISQTSATGALSILDKKISRSVVLLFVFCISFFFYFFYIGFQCVQFAFEMLAVLLHPGGYLAEFSKAGLAKPLPALLSDDQEPAVKQDLE